MSEGVKERKSGRRAGWMAWLPVACLLCLFALLVFSVQLKSPTADEQNHIARGLAYLKTGDLRLSQEHPPGVNAWSAWPLLLDADVQLPLESPSWVNAEWYGLADQLLWRPEDARRAEDARRVDDASIGARAQRIVFATRVPVMWLTLVMAALVYRWARELGGPWAGLSALGLVALDPNLLAHGRLTTTDMGLTCTALATMYAFWRALRAPRGRGAISRPRGAWIVAGIALGMALLSKFSALALVPVAAIAVLVAGRDPRGPDQNPKGLGRPLRFALALGTAAIVVWAGYAFTWGPIAALKGAPGPAPDYWAGLQSILHRTGAGSSAFLLGQVSTQGWWFYFPVAFAVKTPLPALLALGWGIRVLTTALPMARWMGIRKRGKTTKGCTEIGSPLCPSALVSRLGRSGLSCLLLPPLAFWSLAIAGGFNIGYRHVLPALPFLYILAGLGIGTLIVGRADSWATGKRPARSPLPYLLFALYAWLAVETLAIAPHYLAYFNQLAGGPSGGYRVLVDSNLDWGQDLPGLARYVEREGDAREQMVREQAVRVNLSWFGAAHPEAYDLPFHPLPGFWRFGGEAAAYGYNPYAPAPGVYAISATNLQGVKLADRDTYAWFREREPDGQVGHSIRIYRVPAREPPSQEAAVLGVPLAQLTQEDRELLARVDSVRRYDPQTGLILPADARTVWYLTPQPPRQIQETAQRAGYVVGHLDVRSAGMPQPPFSETTSFGGLVAPLRFTAHRAGGEPDKPIQVTVQWGVLRAPHRAAVSFAHLLDGEGRYLAGWDGLNAPATCWQAGDWIEQHYVIPAPQDLPPGDYPIEFGWYDADSGQRWPYVVNGETVGDRMFEEWKIGRVEGDD